MDNCNNQEKYLDCEKCEYRTEVGTEQYKHGADRVYPCGQQNCWFACTLCSQCRTCEK